VCVCGGGGGRGSPPILSPRHQDTHTDARTHAHTHTHARTHPQTHTHTHTHTRTRSSKSTVAAEAAVALNPRFAIRTLQNRVSPETEGVFNDGFWEGLDLVVNALDNVNARLYVDSRCVCACACACACAYACACACVMAHTMYTTAPPSRAPLPPSNTHTHTHAHTHAPRPLPGACTTAGRCWRAARSAPSATRRPSSRA
jgi:hypothetical protein